MKAKKVFCVIAYDIADDRRRYRVNKVVEKYGVRVNFSVYECMLTPKQMETIQAKIEKLINRKEDTVVCYPICVNCFTKIVYQPENRASARSVLVC